MPKKTLLALLLAASSLAEAKNPLSESECLAKIIYAEARGESLNGQIAVAHTVKNRLKNGLGKSACSISRSSAYAAKSIHGKKERQHFMLLSFAVLSGRISDNVKGATHFLRRNSKHKPRWYNKKNVIAIWGKHEFLRKA